MNKNISIVTNFGCQHNCWYCIWKQHPQKNQTGPNIEQVEKFLQKYSKKYNKFSISGGGDCLYNYDLYENWWNKLFQISKKYGYTKIDIHSRTKFYNDAFWNNPLINKLVISSDILEDCDLYCAYIMARGKQIRITHVVTKDTTFEKIDEYLNFCNKYNIQFTCKQLVNYDDNNMYQEIKEKYKNEIFFLNSGDYNIYLMPDGKEYTKFLYEEG